MKFLKYITVFFISFLIIASPVSALDGIASVSMKPENPGPYTDVTLTLESYYFDVTIATITWKVNGETRLEGVGEREFTMKTGSIGSHDTVEVYARVQDGTSATQQITVTPSSIILLYETPNSYIPLFYRGRSLPIIGSTVRVTAIPQISDDGTLVPPQDLSYFWYVNDTAVRSASGHGKQVAELPVDFIKPTTEIRVIARTLLGNTAEKTITITPHQVMPLLYEYDQVFGTLFTKLLDRRHEVTKTFSVVLEPFYVTKNIDGKTPEYHWYLDGEETTPLNGRTLAFQPKEDSYGTKTLDVAVTSPEIYAEDIHIQSEIIFDTRK